MYTLLLIYMMFFGFGRSYNPGSHYSYNLIPFDTIKSYWMNVRGPHTLQTMMINLLGNIVVFIPFGILLPGSYQRLKKGGSFFLVCLSALLLLEISQMLLYRGTMDVDDVILNLLGAGLGFWSLTAGRKFMRRRS
ncbi:VanZ family protein [Paenibacillus lacisoli]|uniref:VanZ family protein n=1 Tax=Paenibacillus lacisoli TaxID=3064525 RepID=UPI00272DC11F|nr:VanZ family protein [Paenibacillus sp. JX-17]